MKKNILFFCLLLLPVSALAAKPSSPLVLFIEPIEKNVSSEDITPGREVELAVSVRSMIDAAEMVVTMELTGGAELTSGKNAWKGPVKSGEEKRILITVKAPLRGLGKIKAKAVVEADKKTSFSAQGKYVLGREVKKDKGSPPVIRKDGRGRDIIEYR